MPDVLHPQSASAHAAALAGRIDDLAAELGIRAHRLAAADAIGEWDGPAARAFRRSAGDLLDELQHAARSLEHAADAVRRGGVVLQAEQERLLRAFHRLGD